MNSAPDLDTTVSFLTRASLDGAECSTQLTKLLAATSLVDLFQPERLVLLREYLIHILGIKWHPVTREKRFWAYFTELMDFFQLEIQSYPDGLSLDFSTAAAFLVASALPIELTQSRAQLLDSNLFEKFSPIMQGFLKIQMASSYILCDELESASECLQEATVLSSSVEFQEIQAKILFQQARFEDAANAFEKLLISSSSAESDLRISLLVSLVLSPPSENRCLRLRSLLPGFQSIPLLEVASKMSSRKPIRRFDEHYDCIPERFRARHLQDSIARHNIWVRASDALCPLGFTDLNLLVGDDDSEDSERGIALVAQMVQDAQISAIIDKSGRRIVFHHPSNDSSSARSQHLSTSANRNLVPGPSSGIHTQGHPAQAIFNPSTTLNGIDVKPSIRMDQMVTGEDDLPDGEVNDNDDWPDIDNDDNELSESSMPVNRSQSRQDPKKQLDDILSQAEELFTEMRSAPAPSKNQADELFEALVAERRETTKFPTCRDSYINTVRRYMEWCKKIKIPEFPITFHKAVLWLEFGQRLAGFTSAAMKRSVRELNRAAIWISVQFGNLQHPSFQCDPICFALLDNKRFPITYRTEAGAIRRLAVMPTHPNYSLEKFARSATSSGSQNQRRGDLELDDWDDDDYSEESVQGGESQHGSGVGTSNAHKLEANFIRNGKCWDEPARKIEFEEYKTPDKFAEDKEAIIAFLRWESQGQKIDARLFEEAFWQHKIDGFTPFQNMKPGICSDNRRILHQYLEYCEMSSFMAFPITKLKILLFFVDRYNHVSEGTTINYTRCLLQHVAPVCQSMIPEIAGTYVTPAELKKSRLWTRWLMSLVTK